MGQLFALALRQMNSTRGLAAVLGLGIVVAAVLLASAPIYARSMADLGLTYTIQKDLADNAASRVELPGVALRTAEGEQLRASVEQRITERLGWFRKSQARSFRLGRFMIAPAGQPLPRLPVLAEPQSLLGYEQHVRVVSGELPKPTDGRVIEVAMSARGLAAAQIQVGDTIDLREEFDNCERELPMDAFPPPPPPCPITERVLLNLVAKVTAVIEPTDPLDVFWVQGSARYFEPFFLPIDNTGPIVVMFAPEETILGGFGSLYPNYRAQTSWLISADVDQLTRTNFARAREDIIGIYDDLEPLNVFAFSPLRDTLSQFGRSADFQQVPLTVLLLEITGIALFYVALVSSIVVERQAPEIALLRGRGASVLQVMAMYLIQGLVIGLPTLIVAPLLAGSLTAVLGLTPLFDKVTGGELLPVTIVGQSWLLAGIGVALAMLALLLPALVAALRGPADVKRRISRPGASSFHRYYLDLVLAAAAILLLFELRERGSVFTPSSTGGISSDPLLLASPALAIAAAGALILRFYPMILRGVSRATARISGPALSLGLLQVVRNSGQYTRLTLLLMMAVAVGTFAASYTRTADRSYSDRANYEAGVDVRGFTHSSLPATVDLNAFEANAAKLPGVTRASAVVRESASIASSGASGTEFQLLGVDPGAAGEMLWTRHDLASKPLPALLGSIDGEPALPGKQLPAGTTQVAVWARAFDGGLGGLTLRAGIRDATGAYDLLEVVELETINAEWTRYAGTIGGGRTGLVEPLTLVSLVFTGTSNRPTGPTLLLDDVEALDAGGKATLLEDFEGNTVWSTFPNAQATSDTYDGAATQAHGGKRAISYKFKTGTLSEVRGIYIPGFLTPLPALVSESFLRETGTAVGGSVLLRVGAGAVVPIVIRGSFDLFPTTHSRDGGLVVFNRDRLLAWTAMAQPSGLGTPLEQNEIWLNVTPEADVDAITTALRVNPFRLELAVTRRELVADATKNPLIAASGSGILFAAFIAVLALVAAALLTSLLAAVRRRRLEFAVARVVGLSRRQLLGMLMVEYSVVFVVGVAAGCLLGLFVSNQMLSFLDVTEAGERVEPGFILETRWAMVAFGVAVVVGVFAAALWLAARVVGRGAEAQALRGD